MMLTKIILTIVCVSQFWLILSTNTNAKLFSTRVQDTLSNDEDNNGKHYSINIPAHYHNNQHRHHKHDKDKSSKSRTHDCIHDYIEVNKHKSPQKYKSHPIEIKRKLNKLKKHKNANKDEIELHRRRLVLSQENYDYIRITPYWNELEKDVNNTELLNYIKILVSSAIEFFESTLKVYPIQDVLYLHPQYRLHYSDSGNYYEPSYFQKCMNIEIPDEHIGTGFAFNLDTHFLDPIIKTVNSGGKGTGIANTDLIIYVSANETDCGENSLAFASSCDQDQYGRPIAGAINFCQSSLENQYFKEDIDITVHELLHVLGMSSGLFPDFINPNTGEVYDEDEVYTKVDNFTYIITDRVKTISQKHYGCDSAIGQPLEDDGGDGTAGSHWEYLQTSYEIMIGQISASDMKVSYFTMGLLEDSGWYIVDYNYIEPYWWGYNTSCKFYAGTCIENNVATFDQYFCHEEAYGCIHNYEQTGECRIGRYPIDIRWFTDDSSIGGFPSVENCPIWYATHNSDTFTGYCLDKRGNNASYNYATKLSNYPIVYDTGARCVNVDTYETIGDEYEYADTSTTLGLCLEHICIDYDNSYNFEIGDIFSKNIGRWNGVTIKIGNNSVNCTRNEGYNKLKKYVSEFDISIECPIVDYICYGELPFKCEYGYYNNELNKCICSPGYNGDTCSNKMTNIRDGTSLYTGTTSPPIIPSSLCISNSNYLNGFFDGTWLQDGIYGVYMSYKYDVNSTNNYYLWFSAWYHMWIISEEKGGYSSERTHLACDLGRYYVPDVDDCNGNWIINNDNKTSDLLFIQLFDTDGGCSDNRYTSNGPNIDATNYYTTTINSADTITTIITTNTDSDSDSSSTTTSSATTITTNNDIIDTISDTTSTVSLTTTTIVEDPDPMITGNYIGNTIATTTIDENDIISTVSTTINNTISNINNQDDNNAVSLTLRRLYLFFIFIYIVIGYLNI